MKNPKRPFNISFATLMCMLLFAGIQQASAYYDPGVQRWINRDPIGESGGANLYAYTSGDPSGRIDPFGWADNKCCSSEGEKSKGSKWDALIAAADAAASAATPGGEFVAALKVFDSCNSLGLAHLYAKRQYDDCLCDALGDSKAEKECDKKWDKKINLLGKTYEKHCKK